MGKNINKRILAVFLLALFLLVIRMAYVQFCLRDELSKAALLQRAQTANVGKTRGEILDKRGVKLTSRNNKIYAVIKPLLLAGKDDQIEVFCDILQIPFNELKQKVETQREPILIECSKQQKDMLNALRLDAVAVINSLARYDVDSVARHVVGYLGKTDQTGEAGVEKFFEKYLSTKQNTLAGVITDAKSKPMEGLGYRVLESEGLDKRYNVKLTIDYRIQKAVEDVMDYNEMKGAVVVEDIATGDIVAMSSKPDFDQNNVAGYLGSPANELFNRAVAAYDLGSIFKIIDVAELFDSGGKALKEFFCNGQIKVGDKNFKCSSYETGGHGWVGLKSAFALSCNSYFINMGLSLGQKNLLEMAKKFGLSCSTGLSEQGIAESKGKLPEASFLPGNTANLAIGQGDVLATPLQVASLIATIANRGVKNQVNIVDAIVDEDGNIVKSMKNINSSRVISEDTNSKIEALMEEVTEKGTGVKARLLEYGGSAGKTGSAETGQYINGEKVVHAWFAGYFPKVQPKYAMAVFIENGKTGGKNAAPIFADIAERILKGGW